MAKFIVPIEWIGSKLPNLGFGIYSVKKEMKGTERDDL